MTIRAVAEAVAAVAAQAVPGATVHLGPPASSGEGLQIAVWFYRVVPNATRRNLPPRGLSGTAPPLTLDLHILLCPCGSDAPNEYEALGALAAALHANPFISSDSPVELIIESLAVDTLVGIWSTLDDEPLRPTLAVLARAVTV